jgi:hypothetical protein
VRAALKQRVSADAAGVHKDVSQAGMAQQHPVLPAGHNTAGKAVTAGQVYSQAIPSHPHDTSHNISTLVSASGIIHELLGLGPSSSHSCAGQGHAVPATSWHWDLG